MSEAPLQRSHHCEGPRAVNLRARNRSLVVGAPLVPIQLSVSRAFPDLMDR